MSDPRIAIIIPVLNEEGSLPLVLADLPRNIVDEIVVVDNGSTDRTSEVVQAAARQLELHVTLLEEPRRGYGSACLRGLSYLRETEMPEDGIVVFLDGDYSDHPEELPDLIRPILDDNIDFVVGSRMKGEREPGAMLPQALFGNTLAVFLIRLFWGFRYSDLGPFRTIRWDALQALKMEDPNFGWTIEMQVKALNKGLKICEVPVRYRRRVGVSKITGTISGTVKAGCKILWTLFRYAVIRK